MEDHTSHDSVSVVRTTFKIYGKANFDPRPTKNRSSPNLNGVITSWTPTTKKIWTQSAQGFLLTI